MKCEHTKGFINRTNIVLLCVCLLLVSCNHQNTTKPPPPTSSIPTIKPNVLRLANGSWPPYNAADLPHGGCDSWVVEEAFATQGISVEYEFLPWVRSYNLSATGVFDGTLAWADTPDHREDHYLSDNPTSIQEWVFFYRKDKPFQYRSIDDLVGKTVGVTSGYVYSDAFINLQKSGLANFSESLSDESNFKMLLGGRIDVFPMERNVGRYILESSFTQDEQNLISETSNSFSQFKSYLLLSKSVDGNAEKMELFNKGLKMLVENGRYDIIMNQCK